MHIIQPYMATKRKRVEFDLMGQFSQEEIDCAKALLSLSTCSTSSSSSSSKTHKQPSSINNKRLKILIHPPKPPSISSSHSNNLPSIESILTKFKNLDTSYGTKYLAKNKIVTSSDVNPIHSCLSIPRSDVQGDNNNNKEFLNPQERDELEKVYANKKKGFIWVKVRGCFTDKEYDLKLGKWYRANGSAFRYVLTGGWNSFKDDNRIQSQDKITVAVVRSLDLGGVLCFAIHGGGGRPQEANPEPATLPCAPLQLAIKNGVRHPKKAKPSSPLYVPLTFGLPKWPNTLPRGAKGADYWNLDRPKLITC